MRVPQVLGHQHAGRGGVDPDLDQHAEVDLVMIDAERVALVDRAEVPQRRPHGLQGLAQRLLADDVGHRVVEPGAVEARQVLGVGRAAHEHALAAELELDALVDHVERRLVDRRVDDRLAQAFERLLAPCRIGLEPRVGEQGVELAVELVLPHVLDVVEERHAEPGRHGDAFEVRGDDLAQVRGLGAVLGDVLGAHPGQHREPRGRDVGLGQIDVLGLGDLVLELGDLGRRRLAQRQRRVGDLVVDDLAVELGVLVARLLVAGVGDAPRAGAQVDVRQRGRERGRQDPGDRRDVRIALLQEHDVVAIEDRRLVGGAERHDVQLADGAALGERLELRGLVDLVIGVHRRGFKGLIIFRSGTDRCRRLLHPVAVFILFSASARTWIISSNFLINSYRFGRLIFIRSTATCTPVLRKVAF